MIHEYDFYNVLQPHVSKKEYNFSTENKYFTKKSSFAQKDEYIFNNEEGTMTFKYSVLGSVLINIVVDVPDKDVDEWLHNFIEECTEMRNMRKVNSYKKKPKGSVV